MSEKPEKKNRFEISREVQEEFVNGIARNMLNLAERGNGKRAGLPLHLREYLSARRQAVNTAARTWFASC